MHLRIVPLDPPCFDHKSGICAFDGSILVEECREAELFCKACFPHSRCGTLKNAGEDVEDENDTSLSSPEDDNDSSEDTNSATAAASIIKVLAPVGYFVISWL